MAKQKGFPIGIEDFKMLIEHNYYFVDKTLFLRDLIDNIGKVHLFTRPRRFGKTLNQSMIQYFFEKQDTDNSYLFEGLNISRAGEEYLKYQGQYSVITLSFKEMKKQTYQKAIYHFKWMISTEFKRHPEILRSDKVDESDKVKYRMIVNETAPDEMLEYSIRLLSDCLFAVHGKRVIILIDEDFIMKW